MSGAQECSRTIIVGVDRQGGHDPIALAKRLLAQDGELTLAHVFPGTARIWHGTPQLESPERRELAEMLERASREADADAHIRWREDDSTGRGLHELCEIAEADLLVVGSSRRGLLGRVLLHDDTHAALNGAPCPVAVAPIGYGDRPVVMREIGVAYDGSQQSDHAIEVARTLSNENGARLSAFETVALPAYGAAAGPAGAAEGFDERVQEARERIKSLGDIEAHSAYGNPVEQLAVYSASLDLLIVGSRGYGPLGRLVHGSTSQHLARVARCPLLVLTRTAQTAETSELVAGREESALRH